MPALLATATLLVACQTPAPAPEPAPPPPVVQSQEVSTDGLFAFGKSEIADDGVEGRAQLDAFAADLLAGPPYEIVHVIGHSDRIGHADANVALSTRRPNSVRDYLPGKGGPAHRTTAVGPGRARPGVEGGAQDRAPLIDRLGPKRR